jgi:Tol biopolymer transport system component
MPRSRAWLVLATASAALLLAFGTAGAESHRGQVDRNGLISFTYQRLDHDLFYFDPATGRTTRLTHGLGDDIDPAPSRDGSQVAFVRAGTTNDLMVVDAAHRRVRTLLRSELKVTHPAWSPDGSKIAFASRNNATFGIYVINADGSGLRRLTRETALDPAWSPDGSTIAFADGRIWLVDATGASPERVLIADTRVSLREPAWSLDGTRLAMRSESSSAKSGNGLFVANADGSALRAIPLPRNYRSQPEWTSVGRVRFRVGSSVHSVFPDGSGRRLVARLTAFSTCSRADRPRPRRDEDDEAIAYAGPVSCETIYGVRSDGSGFRRIAVGPAVEPAYSRDGRRLAFLDPKRSRIFVAGPHGEHPREAVRMARDSIQRAPSWSPDGRSLVFYARRTIWLLDLRRRHLHRLPGTGSGDFDPAWGPKGLIAFSRATRGSADIWVTNPTGTFRRFLKRDGYAPDWSPSGRRIAYQIPRDPTFSEFELGVLDVATRRARRLTNYHGLATSLSPRWSPDGRLIAYLRGTFEEGTPGIFVVTARGTRRTLVYSAGSISTNLGGLAWQPSVGRRR